MEHVDSLYGGYGEGAPAGRGPDQDRIAAEGNRYLEARFPRLDAVDSARVVRAVMAAPGEAAAAGGGLVAAAGETVPAVRRRQVAA